jgi:hypothetical protein
VENFYVEMASCCENGTHLNSILQQTANSKYETSERKGDGKLFVIDFNLFEIN